MWMCAGFAMLESGSVRTKNASAICLKNIGLYSVAGLTYYLHRLQPHVHRRRLLGRLRHLPLRPLGGRTCLVIRRRSGKGIRHQAKLRHDVGLVFSDGLRRHGRLGGFRRHGRTCQTLAVPGFYDHFNGHCLSHRRCLDMGRWMAQPNGFSGFRRLHHRALHRRLGGAGRHHGRGTASGQIPQQRQRQGHAALERAARHPRCPHPVVRVARLQRRLSACAGRRERRRGNEQRAGEHQLGSSVGGCDRTPHIASPTRAR